MQIKQLIRRFWFWDVSCVRDLSVRVAELLAGELGGTAELLLDAQDLVVLAQALRSAGRAGFDLTGGEADDQVGDERVLSLAGAMRHHRAPSVLLRQQMSVDGLGDGADLVDLQQQAVAGVLLDGGLDALWVGDGQVVADNLNASAGVELRPCRPVVLVERILNAHDGEVLDELHVQIAELVRRDVARLVLVLVLLEQIVRLVLVHELRGGDVHADLDLAGVAGLLDGLDDQLQTGAVVQDVGSEAALISDRGRVLAELGLDDLGEVVVRLGAHLHRFREGFRAERQQHELLHGQHVAGVLSAVDDVEGGHWKPDVLVASEVRDVTVQRDALLGGSGLADGQRDAQNGVGSVFVLVGRSIELDHQFIDLRSGSEVP